MHKSMERLQKERLECFCLSLLCLELWNVEAASLQYYFLLEDQKKFCTFSPAAPEDIHVKV